MKQQTRNFIPAFLQGTRLTDQRNWTFHPLRNREYASAACDLSSGTFEPYAAANPW
jgi:hypothetical protein